jgi:hypothetical protein
MCLCSRNCQGGTQIQTHCGEETNIRGRGIAFGRTRTMGSQENSLHSVQLFPGINITIPLLLGELHNKAPGSELKLIHSLLAHLVVTA